jgi:PKD repeat protein
MRYKSICTVLLLAIFFIATVSATTTIINATETSSDSPLRYVTSENLATIRAGAGNFLWTDTYPDYNPVSISSSTTSNEYTWLTAFEAAFDTSGITDTDVIDSVTFSIQIYDGATGLGTLEYVLTNWSPTTQGAVVAGDYEKRGSVLFCNTNQSPTAAGWSNWTGNTNFINAVNKTGYTNAAVRLRADIDNNASLITWSSATSSYINFYSAASAVYKPALTVVHHAAGAGTTIDWAAYGDSTTLGNDAANNWVTLMKTRHNVSAVADRFTGGSGWYSTGGLMWITDYYNTSMVHFFPMFGVADSYYGLTGTQTGQNIDGICDAVEANGSTCHPMIHTQSSTYADPGGTANITLERNYLISQGRTPIDVWDAIDLVPNNGVINGVNESLLSDGTHPTNEAYILMADYVWDHSGLSGGTAPTANFTMNSTSGVPRKAVLFTDTSTDTPTSWTWQSYNDSSSSPGWTTFSTSASSTHTFGNGNFTIKLTVANAYGSDSNISVLNVSAGIGQALETDFTFFPDDHIWNTRVDTLPLDTKSAAYIASSYPDATMWIANIWPINRYTNTTAKQNFTYLRYPEFGDYVPFPITDNATVESIDDAHMIAVNPDNDELYESFWTYQAPNGTWSAEGEVKWNLSSYALRTDGMVTTDAAGLALAPGIVRYEELASGNLTHASRMGLYTSQNTHVWPARADGVQANTSYPPLGQRFRLKSTFDDTGFCDEAKVLVAGWKQYGGMLADQTGETSVWTFSMDDDPRWDYPTHQIWTDMQSIHASDWEAVNVSSIKISDSSGQVNTSLFSDVPIANFIANATSSATVPLAVQFTDTSTGIPTSWVWNMSDGPGTLPENTQQNPVWRFWNYKSYTISLTVTNAFGSNTTTKTNYILVGNASAPVAHFLMSIYTGTPTPIPTPTPTPTPTETPVIPDYGAPASLLVSDAAHGISGTYALGGSYYGGGTQYPAYTAGVDAVSAGGSTYNGSTISTKAALLAALTGASSGDVIYIAPTANIDMGSSENIAIPANVTIASNRGVSGSAGGRIYTKTDGSGWGKPIFRVTTNNVRFTGLRLEGEAYSEASEGDGEATYRVGVWVDGGTGFVVDNCDLYGFAYGDIYLNSIPTSGRPWIHHNYIHGSQNLHEGYGVNVGGGDALIEGNVFDRNRHSITGDGEAGEQYTARYNYFTDSEYQITGMANIDVHERSGATYTSGSTYVVYSNTFAGGSSSGVHQRGKPTTSMTIYKNIFNNYPSGAGWTSGNVPVYQSVPSGYTFGNMVIYDNYVRGTLKSGSTGVLWEQTT